MESKNIFKANIIVSELGDFFEELDNETEKRFLNILNKENFSLADGELSQNAWDIDSDEAFFCNLIRTYEQKENLFDENTCYEMIDNFSREYNMNLYKNDDSERTQRSIYNAKIDIWDNYTKFLENLAWWYSVTEFKEQNALLDELSEICAEFDDESRLEYDVTVFTSMGKVKMMNNERVDVIALIARAKDALSELKKFIKKSILSKVKGHLFKETPVSEIEKFLKENSHSEVNDLLDSHSEIGDLLKKAEKLLKNNQENEIFINNDISFEYLYDNNLFYRARKQREIF